MEEIIIKAERRKGTGKEVAKKLRREGKIPAILYGKDTTPIPISIDAKEWNRLKNKIKSTSIVSLEIEGNGYSEKRFAMLKEVQRDFLNLNVLHLDFLQISLQREIEVEIPIVLVGKAKGVERGGIVEQHLRSIVVECLPTKIPEKIELDITDLDIGDSLHVHEVSIPDVKLVEHPEVAIVTIVPPEVEESAPQTPKEEA